MSRDMRGTQFPIFMTYSGTYYLWSTSSWVSAILLTTMHQWQNWNHDANDNCHCHWEPKRFSDRHGVLTFDLIVFNVRRQLVINFHGLRLTEHLGWASSRYEPSLQIQGVVWWIPNLSDTEIRAAFENHCVSPRWCAATLELEWIPRLCCWQLNQCVLRYPPFLIFVYVFSHVYLLFPVYLSTPLQHS